MAEIFEKKCGLFVERPLNLGAERLYSSYGSVRNRVASFKSALGLSFGPLTEGPDHVLGRIKRAVVPTFLEILETLSETAIDD